MKKYGMIVSSVFLLLVLICAARVFSADSKADKIRSEHPISTDFEENLSPSSKEELFKAILKLAVWESETREALDKTYGYTDDEQALSVPWKKITCSRLKVPYKMQRTSRTVTA